MGPTTLAVICLIIITIIAVYFPIAYIRLTNKLLSTLKQIETNTHK